MFIQRILPRHAVRPGSRWPLLVIAAVALAIMVPELVFGLTVSDSYRFNLLWPEQFGELFRAGNPYPRWLPRSWNGMGAPVFYFYPPLFFWVAAGLNSVTGGLLPVERVVPIASLVLLAASSFAMRAWLRSFVSDNRALAGAVLYMLTPYHLYDIYCRGALAEATAYASVPVVMLALARIGSGLNRYAPLLAAGYCVLLLSHLPTALLVTLFLILPYVLFVARRSAAPARFILFAGAGGLAGIALAAIYILPALTLLTYVSPRVLTGGFYQPSNWFFWHFEPGPMGARMYLIIPASVAALLVAAGAVMKGGRPELRFWSALVVGLVLLIAGVIPAVWNLPGLSLVQFPWRALLLVDFACVTLLAIALPTIPTAWLVSASAAAAYSYVVLALMAGHTIGRTVDGGVATAASIRASSGDAPEYLPAGMPMKDSEGPVDVIVSLPQQSVAIADRADARVKYLNGIDGGMIVSVDSPAPTKVTLPRFTFPIWRLLDGQGASVPMGADATRLVTFEAPAGHSTYRLSVGSAPTERLARCLSGLGLLAVGLLAGLALRSDRRGRNRSWSAPRLDAVADIPL